MAQLRKQGDKLYAAVSFEEKEKLNSLITKRFWDPTAQAYLFPLKAVRDLLSLFPRAYLNSELEEYLSSYNRKLRRLFSLQVNPGLHSNTLPYLPETRPYQKTGVSFLYAAEKTLLADEMGLGKALQSLSLSLVLKEEGRVKKVLIVCPNSIKYSVWEKEVIKWTGLSYTILDGSKQEKLDMLRNLNTFYLIANYEALRKPNILRKKKKVQKEVTSYWKEIKMWNPDLVILDECQGIKNPSAQQTLAIKELDAPFKVLLTGTPILNRVEELWSLMHYLDPEYWNSYNKFIIRYCTFKDLWIGKGRRIKAISGSQNVTELQERIAPYYLRRTKAEVMPYLPERIYETRMLGLTEKQNEKYAEFLGETKQELKSGVKITHAYVAGKVTKLLEVCDGLSLFDLEDSSMKLDECEKIYQELPSDTKVVYFSWFRKTSRTLQERFLKDKIRAVEIDGSVPAKIRKDLIDEFQNDPKCRILTATISTCGVGIDLTAGNVCVFISRAYTPAINEQAESRLHRSGQKKAVSIITLVSEGTVEEKVSKILETKRDLFEEVFQDKERLKEALETFLFS